MCIYMRTCVYVCILSLHIYMEKERQIDRERKIQNSGRETQKGLAKLGHPGREYRKCLKPVRVCLEKEIQEQETIFEFFSSSFDVLVSDS